MSGRDRYTIRARILGELSSAWWSGVFEGLAVEPEPDGTTVVSGDLPDDAALHGLLAAIRDLGLSLISIESLPVPEPSRTGDE